MTYLVPFDGSDLAATALSRAATFRAAEVTEHDDIVVVCVVPRGNARYARERGWLGPDESFDRDRIAARIRELVRAIVPSSRVRFESVGRRAQPGDVAARIRTVAADEEATTIFLGSDNAGHMVTSISSVAGSVAAETPYDVVIVRQVDESVVERMDAVLPPDGADASDRRGG